MISKIEEFWQTLDEKQQIYAVVSAVVLVLWLLFIVFYFPLKTQNQTLNSQLQTQSDIHQQLISARKKHTHFAPISRQNVKSIISKIATQKNLIIDLNLNKNQLILIAKNQAFNDLKNLLLSLRHKYAITTVKASIIKTRDGFVDADLTLALP